MKRSAPWAILACYPLVALAVLNLLGGPFEAILASQLAASSLGALVVAYWWPFLVLTEFCVITFFLIGALRNRRIRPAWRRVLWAVGIVLLAVIAIPAYWWTYSEREPQRGSGA
jgi:hypothetical protein